jgi:hypothetical protein
MNAPICAAIGLSAAAICLGACSTLDDTRSSGYYLGLVSVKLDKSTEPMVRVVNVDMFGAWVDTQNAFHSPEAGVGLKQSHLATFSRDCRIMVIVKTDRQLADVEAFIESLEAKDPVCASKS